MDFKIKPQFFKPTNNMPPPTQQDKNYDTIEITADENNEATVVSIEAADEIKNGINKRKRTNTDEIKISPKKKKQDSIDEIKKDSIRKQKPNKTVVRVSLTNDERVKLRSHQLTLPDLHNMAPEKLSVICNITVERAKYLVAMVQFQRLGSVGFKFAQYLCDLGCRSIPDLAKRDPVDLYEKLCDQSGTRLDPCAEDVLRCAVAQARFPELPDECRNWWYWKTQRGQHNIDFKIQDIKYGKRA